MAWTVSKNAHIPLHECLPPADELPWTISYVIRKRVQIDSFNELPEEKRPPENMIWYGTSKEIDTWFKKVYKRDGKGEQDTFILDINERDIG